MHGSTASFATWKLARRLMLVAMVAIAVFAARLGYSAVTEAGPPPSKITVNSADNTDDGDCETLAVGDCTLHEAIDLADGGGVDLINFDPVVFPKNLPTTIDVTSGLGQLPILEETGVTISAEGAGVIIDGGGTEDIGLDVHAEHDNFDFTLTGSGGSNGYLEITGFLEFGVLVCGDDTGTSCDMWTLRDVVIDDIIVRDIGDDAGFNDGISVRGTQLIDVAITDNVVDVDEDALDGIFLRSDPVIGLPNVSGDDIPDAGDQTVVVSGNTVTGPEFGIAAAFRGDLASAIDVCICDGNQVTTNAVDTAADAVNLNYIGQLIEGKVSFRVDDNGALVSGDHDAVAIRVDATSSSNGVAPFGSDNAQVNVSADRNTTIEGDNKAVDIEVDICCAQSDSTSTISVDGTTSSDIVGHNDDAVDVEASVCCGTNNTSTVSVSDNLDIVSEDGNAVDIESAAFGDQDGANGHTSTVTVDGNEDITGSDSGVDIESIAGTEDACCSADNNTSTVNVTNNELIIGEDDAGVEIQSRAGTVDGAGEQGDDNLSEVHVDSNDDITGDEDGVEIDAAAGGDTFDSDDNSTDVTVDNNEDITGGSGDPPNFGIEIGLLVCCDPDNTNTASVSGNASITSADDDAINIAGAEGITNANFQGEICCSANTITIEDNARGPGEEINPADDPSANGIEIRASIQNLVLGSPSTNLLNINNNNIVMDNGSQDGVQFCCGDLSDSNFNDNDITGDGTNDDGIDIGRDDSDDVWGENVSFLRNDVEGHGSDGLHIDGDDADFPNDFQNLTIADNNDGFSDNEDDGIFIQANDLSGLSLTNNVIDGNGSEGVRIEDASDASNMVITGNAITDNDNDGLQVDNAGTIRGTLIDDNDVLRNGDSCDHEGLDLEAGGISHNVTITNNRVNENWDSGMEIQDGDGTFPADWDGSVVADNEFHENGQGAGICTTFGAGIRVDGVTDILVEHNSIFGNMGPASGIDVGDLLGVITGSPAGDGGEAGITLQTGRITISQNMIWDNAGLGIDLGADGVGCTFVPAAAGPNRCIAVPKFQSAQLGKVGGTACPNCDIELFIADNDPPDQSGHGEGKRVIAKGMANAIGDWNIEIPCDSALPDEAEVLTATATDEDGNTSEFAANIPFVDLNCTPTITNTPTETFTPTDTRTPTNTPPPTNTPLPEGSITICKDTDPETDGIEFDFEGDLGDFTLEDDECMTDDGLELDDYEITELETAGWDLESISCSGTSLSNIDVDLPSASVTVTLKAGAEVTCRFDNDQGEAPAETGNVTICKDTNPETEGISFSFDEGDFDMEDDECVEFEDLAVAEYIVEEDVIAGWNLTDIECIGTDADNIDADLPDMSVIITLLAGEDVLCTFTNTQKPTETPTFTPTNTSTPTPTNTPTNTPTRTNTPTSPGTTPGTGVSYGDVNKNGVVNAIDAQLVMQDVAGLINLANPENADVDQDGDVDIIDAAIILQFIAGLLNSLPV